jgi:HAD superfamily hydrolase (TIGR01662 family)
MADMYEVTQEHWIPEKDAVATIAILHERGYRLGLVSNGADDANTQALVDKLGVRRFFDIVLSSAAAGIRKPNPQIFFKALEAIQIPAIRAVMVGDKLETDILGAHQAGIYSIWITRRADTATNRAHRSTIHPNAIINSLDELPILLDQR